MIEPFPGQCRRSGVPTLCLWRTADRHGQHDAQTLDTCCHDHGHQDVAPRGNQAPVSIPPDNITRAMFLLHMLHVPRGTRCQNRTPSFPGSPAYWVGYWPETPTVLRACILSTRVRQRRETLNFPTAYPAVRCCHLHVLDVRESRFPDSLDPICGPHVP